MSDDVAIQVNNISKDFILPHEKAGSIKGLFTTMLRPQKKGNEIQHALKNVSFEVKKGEFFGIVGRNGSGKSTLLKMLAGIYQPTEGQLSVNGRLVPFIELGVGFNAELTGRENVYLNGALIGFSKSEIDAMYDEVVEFAELERFMDQKLKNYSSGMQVRLAFSLAIQADADILLVDEVLAVGDADFQKKCYKYFKDLKKLNKTVIFVSHDMNAVEEYCDRAVLIEKSKLIVEGSSHDVAMSYTRMFLEQDNNKDKLKNKKKRWGSKKALYDDVSINPKQIEDTEVIKIQTTATIMQDLEQAVFGFKVRADDDAQILGSNTKIKKQLLRNLHKGDKLEIEWSMPNIFNTGNYFIDLAIQSEDYGEVYDWWEEATILQVERSEPNPYPFHPIIKVVVKK